MSVISSEVFLNRFSFQGNLNSNVFHKTKSV